MKISENRLRSIIRGIVKESINQNANRRSLRESDPMMDEYDYDSYPDEEFAYEDMNSTMDNDAYIPSDIESEEEMVSPYGVAVDDSELTGVDPLEQDESYEMEY